jgi:large subunit ribosomal protein L28
MPRKCYFTGKKTRIGGQTARRGKAKYLGGVGRKITGRSKRKFRVNIQRVRAVVDGRVTRLRVSAKAIRMGLVTKPIKRDWKPNQEGQVQEAVEAVAVEQAVQAEAPKPQETTPAEQETEESEP